MVRGKERGAHLPIRIDARIANEEPLHVDVVGVVQKLLGKSRAVVPTCMKKEPKNSAPPPPPVVSTGTTPPVVGYGSPCELLQREARSLLTITLGRYEKGIRFERGEHLEPRKQELKVVTRALRVRDVLVS
jgi:hypothetical protein